MPTYEYKCSNGHNFELFQRISEDAVDTCPACGAKAERLLSAGAGLIFKGSGFYITDYRSDSYKKASQAETGTSTTGKSEGAKSEGGKSEGPAPSTPPSAPSKTSE